MIRRAAIVLALAGCTNEGHPPIVQPPTTSVCTPESEGYGDLPALDLPAFTLPPGCRILEDDGRMAIFRRQVTVIESADELDMACVSGADGGMTPFDGGVAPLVDFSTQSLLVMRIPDTTQPRWAVRQGNGNVVFAESSAICTGIDPKPRRYMRLIPRSATVTFHLCQPEGCEEDPG